jgi:hypothetical protein
VAVLVELLAEAALADYLLVIRQLLVQLPIL